MEYCRSLKFEQEPNYKTCVGFFENCMNRNSFDATVFDYTWKQNRLAKDKEALKNSLMNIIHKKPKKQADETKKPEVSRFKKVLISKILVATSGKERMSNINN